MKKNFLRLVFCGAICISLMSVSAIAVGDTFGITQISGLNNSTTGIDCYADDIYNNGTVPTAADVQKMINELPEGKYITAENRAEVEEKLNEIDEARFLLQDEIDMLDFTRYEAAVAALNVLDGVPDAGEPQLMDDSYKTQLENDFRSGVLSITLTQDVSKATLNCTQGGNTDMVLDLNGHKLEGIIVFLPRSGKGGLTIKNGTIDGGGGTAVSYSGSGESTITIENVKLENAVVSIQSGTLQFKNSSISGELGAVLAVVSGSATIDRNSEIKQMIIYDGSEVNIEGGTFSNYVELRGTANISGGDICRRGNL